METLVAVLTILHALSTWYLKRQADRNRSTVIRSTAAQITSDEILTIVKDVLMRVEVIESRDRSIDNRGPNRKE